MAFFYRGRGKQSNTAVVLTVPWAICISLHHLTITLSILLSWSCNYEPGQKCRRRQTVQGLGTRNSVHLFNTALSVTDGSRSVIYLC